jgi:hypothetical protein
MNFVLQKFFKRELWNMKKSKFMRQIIGDGMLLCAGMFIMIAIRTEVIGCISDPADRYAGIYFVYPKEVGQTWILAETDTGVNNNFDHRRIHFEYDSSCAEPNWEYYPVDYNYWDDGSGIPGKRDRRLWVTKATGLTPDCFYDAEFKYRDYFNGCRHSTPKTLCGTVAPLWDTITTRKNARVIHNVIAFRWS